jgi:hypothetical protein
MLDIFKILNLNIEILEVKNIDQNLKYANKALVSAQ